MSLEPGYNIVTEEVEDTELRYRALEFFRLLAHDKDIENHVTVTGLENLIYNAYEEDREEIIAELRNILRQTSSLSSTSVIQFLIDGKLFHDDRFRIRIERSGESVHINIGELFVEEPRRLSPHHAVSRK